MTDYIITGKAVERWDLPTAIMAQEIVRCRDCKYLIAHGAGCSYWDNCDIESVDGFCAWGERKQ